jgi:hypothetical protein
MRWRQHDDGTPLASNGHSILIFVRWRFQSTHRGRCIRRPPPWGLSCLPCSAVHCSAVQSYTVTIAHDDFQCIFVTLKTGEYALVASVVPCLFLSHEQACVCGVMSSTGSDSGAVASGGPASGDPALLAHYKERVAQFEQERSELLNSIDLIKVQHEESHRMRWEVRAREDEVRPTNKCHLSQVHCENLFLCRFFSCSVV